MPNKGEPPRRPAARLNTAAGFVAGELARGRKGNRLLQEVSPYLLQHAFNPVAWYPWGDEAFAEARRTGKVIFLSIGYSTCHWCRVMAEENFEQEETAALLNRHFIAIKVDREERPDLDRIYMAAAQALGGRGGWPLSVFLTPERQPFYAGTYFPPRPRHGLPGFPELLREIERLWQEKREALLRQGEELAAALRQLPAAAPEPGEEEARRGYRQFLASYDGEEGGFGPAPKFPRPGVFVFLLRYYQRYQEPQALAMVRHSLARIAAGGICDQLGGGFHRYAVDGRWRVPHFEKMLSDQAQLAVVALELWQITGEGWAAELARRTLDYVLRDLGSEEGGFYSAEDADSPKPDDRQRHGEGAFYLWSRQEIVVHLEPAAAEIFLHHYGVEAAGNAPDDPHGDFQGLNILYQAKTVAETAAAFQRTPAEIAATLAQARQLLLAVRDRRPYPHLDDKIDTAWNGLLLSALARAGRVLGEARYLAAAERLADFLQNTLYDREGGLLFHRYRAGQVGVAGQLEDYAFFGQGLLDLYEAGLDRRWLQLAIALNERQHALFWDRQGGGFFETSDQDQTLLARMKGDYDAATPAGNSVAALNLLRLAALGENPAWRRRGQATINAFAAILRDSPQALPQMLAALDFSSRPRRVVLAGRRGGADTLKLQEAINRLFLPDTVVVLAESGGGAADLAGAWPRLADYPLVGGQATAYLCADNACRPPLCEGGALSALLANGSR